MFLLQAQQISAGDPQQQAIIGLDAAVSQRGKDPFTTSLQLENIHIESTLQPAVPQGLSDQG